MRYLRVIAAVGLASAVVAGTVLVSPSPGRSHAATARPQRLSRSLIATLPALRRLTPWGMRPQFVPRLHQLTPLPGPSMCFVGPGRCSETPCVVPVQNEPTTSAVSAVVDTATTRRVWPNQAAGQGCPRGGVTPHILRVTSR